MKSSCRPARRPTGDECRGTKDEGRAKYEEQSKKTTCYLLRAMSGVAVAHLSPITYHLSLITYHLSLITYLLSLITYHLSLITYTTRHLSDSQSRDSNKREKNHG